MTARNRKRAVNVDCWWQDANDGDQRAAISTSL